MVVKGVRDVVGGDRAGRRADETDPAGVDGELVGVAAQVVQAVSVSSIARLSGASGTAARSGATRADGTGRWATSR